MNPEFLRKDNDVIALPQAVYRHLTEGPRVSSHSSFPIGRSFRCEACHSTMSQNWGSLQYAEITGIIAEGARHGGIGRRLLSTAEDSGAEPAVFSRSPPIHGLTTSSRRPATRAWALRLLTGASTIAERFSSEVADRERQVPFASAFLISGDQRVRS